MLKETIDRIDEDDIPILTLNEKRAYFSRWYFSAELQLKHPTQRELGDFLGVSKATIQTWKRNVVKNSKQERVENLLDLILEDALRPDADTQTRKLAAELTGLKKKENEDNTFEPTAEDYARWGKQLRTRLIQDRVQSGGICFVCGGSKVLFSEVRMDTEQEHSPDGEMADVALPDGYAGHLSGEQGDSDPQS